RIRDRKRWAVPCADPARADGVDEERSRDAAEESAIGERGDSEVAAPDDPAENDEDVVEQRPKCGEKKEPVREKHGGDNASDVKEDLGGKKDARETRAERELLSREAVEHPARDLRCKDFGNDHAGDEHRCHYSNDDRESLLRFSFALLREEAGVDRDKSDGGSASSDDGIQ